MINWIKTKIWGKGKKRFRPDPYKDPCEFVYIITLHRRYFELAQSIKRYRKYRHLFPENTKLVVIYSDPEPNSYLDLMGIDIIIPRPSLYLEGARGTSYAESYNVRAALEYVSHNLPNATGAIVQATDSWPTKALLEWFVQCWGANVGASTTGGGDTGLLFITACFFVDPHCREYWPPLLGPDDPETLEWSWGKIIRDNQLPNFKIYYPRAGFTYFTSHDFTEQTSWLRVNP